MPHDLALLLLEPLAPQAGGGGSFGTGSGGGGFSGGGGGDGLGTVIYLLLRLVIAYPLIGVPTLVVAAVVFVVGTQRGWWKHQERVIHRAAPARRAQRSARSAEVLKEHDPAFDEARFLERVRTAFHVAQDSWCAQDLRPLRHFVSDGVYERFSLQLEEQREDGWRQGMEGTEVTSLAIAHVAPGRHFDAITARIAFRSTIDRRSLETGERLRGSVLPKEIFAVCYTFVRRRGAKTELADGLIEGKCPNCAAPLTLRQSATCEHCDALVRSGQFDWVLTEITQASEWRPEEDADVAGLEAYRERDPGLSVQLLEDRASVAFWRKAAADRAGDPAPLTRVATEALCAERAELYARRVGDVRVYRSDRAVGSVRTLAVVAGEAVDRAVVEVVWDGRRARVDSAGERRLEEARAIRRSLFVFEREAGRTSSLDHAFSTAHCTRCGAHDLGGTAPECAYCGAPRTGDGSTWLLARIANRGTPEGYEVEALVARAESGATPAIATRSSEDLILWAAALVHADGEVSDEERRAVESLARRSDVASARVELLLGVPPGDGAVPRPWNDAEAREWFEELVRLALADGRLSGDERLFLRDASEELGLDRREMRRLLVSTRKGLYRESKRA